MQTLTEAEFEAQYTTIESPSFEPYWEFEEIQIEGIDPHHVWSVIDSDDGNTAYLDNGYRVVNKWAYVVTAEPWVEDTLAVWMEFSEDDED